MRSLVEFSLRLGNVSLNTVFEVDVIFPQKYPNALFGTDKALVTVDSFHTVAQIIQQVCTRHGIPNVHLVSLTLRDQLLEEDGCLTQYGLGSNFQTCTLKIVPKKFPQSSGNRERGKEACFQ
jgi:hypothetical protein